MIKDPFCLILFVAHAKHEIMKALRAVQPFCGRFSGVANWPKTLSRLKRTAVREAWHVQLTFPKPTPVPQIEHGTWTWSSAIGLCTWNREISHRGPKTGVRVGLDCL